MFNQNKNRVFKLFISILLVILVFISIFNTNAYGLWNLTDVPEDAYYYEAVYDMHKKGVVKGYPDLEFKPFNNVTVAEAISLVFRIADVDYIETNQSVWYYDVMEKAKQLRIVSQDVNPNTYATRLDIGEYIIGVYGIDISVYGIDISKTTVSQVFIDTNSLIANTMYEQGVFVGVPTGNGFAYLPDAYITRADLCIVLSRLENLLELSHREVIGVGNYTVYSNPSSYNDILLVVKALGESSSSSLTIPYNVDLCNADYYAEIRTHYQEAFRYCFKNYPEYFSFYSRFSIKRQINSTGDSYITIVLSNANNIDDETILKMRNDFNIQTQNVIKELRDSGKLADNMSSIDKIKVLFEYVAVNTEYDTSYTPVGYTGYGAAINKKAVCQGYTAYFNNLCKQLGFETEGVSGVITKSGIGHMWSRIKVNNEWRYFDVTFADPIPNKAGYCDFNWFNLNYDAIMKDRKE